jgi:hypothetical protein
MPWADGSPCGAGKVRMDYFKNRGLFSAQYAVAIS